MLALTIGPSDTSKGNVLPHYLKEVCSKHAHALRQTAKLAIDVLVQV